MDGIRDQRGSTSYAYAHAQNQAGSISATNALTKERPATRIESDIEAVRLMTLRVENAVFRITSHARAMGYFEPSPADGQQNAMPTPVITAMADALRALDRALDSLNASVGVFD